MQLVQLARPVQRQQLQDLPAQLVYKVQLARLARKAQPAQQVRLARKALLEHQ